MKSGLPAGGGKEAATGAHTVTVLPDGKILSLGGVSVAEGTAVVLTRHLADGAADRTFGFEERTIDRGTRAVGLLGLQPSGAIVVGGDVLARFDPSGQRDARFAGKVPVRGGRFEMHAIAMDRDGKILVAGAKRLDADTAFETFAIARFEADGTVDARFQGGVITTVFGDYSAAYGVTLDADGKILANGIHDYDYVIARYAPNGALDASFGNGGKVFGAKQLDGATTLLTLPDGKLLMIGVTMPDASTKGFAMVRHLPNGRIDASFGEGGIVNLPVTLLAWVNGAALDANGNVVIVGTIASTNASEEATVITRVRADGALDTSFGSGGFTITRDVKVFKGLALQPNGRIVLAGAAGDELAVARYCP